MSTVDEQKTADTGDGLKAGSSRVSFTHEQQAKVQELIDDAYRKAYAKASGNMVSKSEVEGIRSKLSSMKEEQKTAALLRSISRHNTVDASEVAELIRPYVSEHENGGFSIMAPHEGEKSNGGSAMDIDDYVDTWLAQRPHHLRSYAAAGAGSRSALFGESSRSVNLSDPSVWRKMPREDLDKLLNEGVSVQGTSGQIFSFKDVKNPFVEARKRKVKTGG